MSDRLQEIRSILHKYKLDDPVEESLRKQFNSFKQHDLKGVLKKTGRYSMFAGVIYGFYFLLKKLGIGVTIVKSTVVLSVGAVTLVGSLSTGTYYTIKHIVKPQKKIEKKDIFQKKDQSRSFKKVDRKLVPQVVRENNSKQKTEKKLASVIIKEYGVVPFSVENVPASIANKVTSTVIQSLSKKGSTMRITSSKQNAVRKMVIGSIERLGGTYTVSMRLVRVKDSKILKLSSKSVSDETKIQEICIQMIQNIMRLK